jgi:hypothetical protein
MDRCPPRGLAISPIHGAVRGDLPAIAERPPVAGDRRVEDSTRIRGRARVARPPDRDPPRPGCDLASVTSEVAALRGRKEAQRILADLLEEIHQVPDPSSSTPGATAGRSPPRTRRTPLPARRRAAAASAGAGARSSPSTPRSRFPSRVQVMVIERVARGATSTSASVACGAEPAGCRPPVNTTGGAPDRGSRPSQASNRSPFPAHRAAERHFVLGMKLCSARARLQRGITRPAVRLLPPAAVPALRAGLR